TADGDHTVHFRATDRAGNVTALTGFSLTLDSQAPAVVITTPTPGQLANRNVVVTGKVTDNLSGEVTLLGQGEDGPLVPVTSDSSGSYSFATTLVLDGSGDGNHTAHLRGTDRAGNVSAIFDIPFTLDTTPPPVTFDLDPRFDTVPLGDQQTHFEVVTLVGQT